jgi:predicted Zn-dependent protease with MMP-like domain
MRLTRSKFQHLVSQAMSELPVEVLNAMENVVVVIRDLPSKRQLEAGKPEDLYSILGLYEGIPRPDRDGYNLALPDRITIFQRPLEVVCISQDELLNEVKATIIHEIGHHLGWSDDDLRQINAD